MFFFFFWTTCPSMSPPFSYLINKIVFALTEQLPTLCNHRIHKRCNVTCFLCNCIIRGKADREALSLLTSPPPSFHPQHNHSGRSQFSWRVGGATEPLLLMCSMWRCYCEVTLKLRSGRFANNSLSMRAAEVIAWRMCHCLLRVSSGKSLFGCIDEGKGGLHICRVVHRGGAVDKTVTAGQVWSCAVMWADKRRVVGSLCLRGGHVLLWKSIMFGFWSGRARLCSGRRIWCSANPFCERAAAAAAATLLPLPPLSPSTSPHPAPSLLVLLTGVYVKALRKTITLNCTQPSGSKLAEVDGAACLCMRVQMFADLTVNPPPQKNCLWAVMLAVSNVYPLICFATWIHGGGKFVLRWPTWFLGEAYWKQDHRWQQRKVWCDLRQGWLGCLTKNKPATKESKCSAQDNRGNGKIVIFLFELSNQTLVEQTMEINFKKLCNLNHVWPPGMICFNLANSTPLLLEGDTNKTTMRSSPVVE